VLTMDVRKYFPSIDHAILKATVRRALKDENVLWLCDRIIDEANDQEPVRQYFSGDRLFDPTERRHGIPIGNLTSQVFANLYLDPLDHFVTERLRVGRYLRYMDDFCCFGDDRDGLRAVRAAIREELAAVRLRLNEGKSRLRRVREGITFLGFVVRPSSLRLNQRGVRRQRQRVRRLRRGFAEGTIDWQQVAASLTAWQAHAAHGTTARLCRQVLANAVFSRPAGGERGIGAACASAAGAGKVTRAQGRICENSVGACPSDRGATGWRDHPRAARRFAAVHPIPA